MILVMAFFLITYTFHSTWVTSEAYSSPSIVLSARGGDGSRIIFDDFREAYYWLRHNTPEVSHTRGRQGLENDLGLRRIWTVERMFSVNELWFVFSGCQSHVMVGLWLSDNCHGESNHSSGQQHVEQHAHLQSWTGELINRQYNQRSLVLLCWPGCPSFCRLWRPLRRRPMR